MINKLKKLKFIYIFYISAVFVLFGTLSIYSLFGESKTYIENVTKNIYINYLFDITQNISDMIVESTSKDIYNSLDNDKDLIIKLEKNLQLFISDRYRYIYVVDKSDENSEDFRFLLDGAKDLEDKSEFKELYEPLNIAEFQNAYKNKKETYFIQKDAQGVWMTFIKPIVVENETRALLIVDFSMQGHSLIDKSLHKLDSVLATGVYVGVFIFLIIVLFAYIDNRRSKELEDFNKRLRRTVKNEVEKNRQKDQQLLQQSRLAQMGEMISMIAHQWRQPLAAISSSSATIKLKAMLGKLDKDSAIELSTNIATYSQHLSVTIDDFRDFFKSNKEKRDTTYGELVENVLGIIGSSIQNKNITLKKDLKSEVVFNTYKNELKQVVLNLIKNAEDILLEKNIKDPEIVIRTYENTLTVSDNGGGIPEDIIDKIFDPYFSTKLEKNGTGLGLYMSKTIIHEHCGGELSVQNSDEGAVFTIALKP
jgi:signal transduction histidine kinase